MSMIASREFNYFTSMESKLIIENKMQKPVNDFKVIPKPYYLVVIFTKKMRQEEESLNKVAVSFEKF